MNAAKILEAIKGLDQKFEAKLISLENQFQVQRADIIEIKEKVLAALDSTSAIPGIVDIVDRHREKIEVLEQKAIVFDTAIKSLSK